MNKYNKIGLGMVGIMVLVISIALFSLPRASNELSADYSSSYNMSNMSMPNYSTNSSGNNISQVSANRVNVSIIDDSYSPKALNITPGTMVTWTNNGTMAHTVTADDGSFNSGPLNPGQSFSWTFNFSGTAPYHCLFHGAAGGIGMSGTIFISGTTSTSNNNGSTNGSSTGSGSFSLSSNNNFCVSQTPVYTITAPSTWGGQTINWTSSHNGSASGQNSFILNSSGSWSQSGDTWGSGDVGQWTKTASINGTTQSLNFSVQNCSGVTTSNPSAASIIGSSNDSFGAGSDAVDIAFPVNTTNNNSNLYGGFNGPDTPAPVYLANGTVVTGNQTSPTSQPTNTQNSYYDQNGFLCKPPGSW